MLKAWSPAERGWKLWSGTLLEEVMPLGRSRTPRPSLPLCFPVLKFQSRIPLPWCSASSPAPKRQGAYGTLELIWLKLWAKINISLFLSCFFWIFFQIGGTVYNESNVQGIEKGMGEAPPPHWSFLSEDFCSHILYSEEQLQKLNFVELSHVSIKPVVLAVPTQDEPHYCGFKSYRALWW